MNGFYNPSLALLQFIVFFLHLPTDSMRQDWLAVLLLYKCMKHNCYISERNFHYFIWQLKTCRNEVILLSVTSKWVIESLSYMCIVVDMLNIFKWILVWVGFRFQVSKYNFYKQTNSNDLKPCIWSPSNTLLLIRLQQ